MNGTTGKADLSSGMFDAPQRESEHEEWSQTWIHHELREASAKLQRWRRVSNNLGVYFLFCLFGLAFIALFLCRSSMQALQTSLFFFVLRRHVWQVFMYQ